MNKKRKKNKSLKIRSWIIITISILLLLFSLLFIFQKQSIYYSRKVYHELLSLKKKKPVPSSNKTTNLYSGVNVPKGEVFGIDISRHQGEINWKLLEEFRFRYNKIDFVYIKATESIDWKDNTFAKNWKNSKKHNFIRGAYHFFNPNVSVELQMENFFESVNLSKGDLPPMLDVEQESLISKDEYRNAVLSCLRLMESHYKMKPVLYINQVFYLKYFKTNDFKEYSLWISRLKRTEPPQSNWVFWQFSHSAIVPGISEYVDFNIFNGSLNVLKIIQKK